MVLSVIVPRKDLAMEKSSMSKNPSESQVSHLVRVIITKGSSIIPRIAVGLQFPKGPILVIIYCYKVTSFGKQKGVQTYVKRHVCESSEYH